MNEQNPNEKLLALADHIDSRYDFNQDLPKKCVIGIGLEFAGIDGDYVDDVKAFAEHYGITKEQAEALFWGQYGDIFPNEWNHNSYQLYRVASSEATRILRRLATE
jgi:hypothetical protein